jgi:FHS family L-fucose permease-like MFS transporter
VAGLGKYTSEASALLIMMILGGAVIPPLQGVVGDGSIGLHRSYLVAAACFVILAALALKMKSVLQKQGIDFDKQIGGGH